nr:ph-response regulator protein palf/rim8 [Quercus suber]
MPISEETEPPAQPSVINGTSEVVVRSSVVGDGDQDDWSRHPPRGHSYIQDHESMDHYEPEPYDYRYEELPPPIPMPQVPDESDLSEKEVMRRAENRLLPSQPPNIDGEGVRNGTTEPTAPYLPDEDALYAATGQGSSSVYRASASTMVFDGTDGPSTSAPRYDDPASGSLHFTTFSDDKQEQHRRNLELAASAPPGDDDDEATDPSTVAAIDAPSAPAPERVHASGEDLDSHADAIGSSGLPRYTR